MQTGGQSNPVSRSDESDEVLALSLKVPTVESSINTTQFRWHQMRPARVCMEAADVCTELHLSLLQSALCRSASSATSVTPRLHHHY
jgi:hypothetical protein